VWQLRDDGRRKPARTGRFADVGRVFELKRPPGSSAGGRRAGTGLAKRPEIGAKMGDALSRFDPRPTVIIL
jgi:hypothetical protein